MASSFGNSSFPASISIPGTSRSASWYFMFSRVSTTVFPVLKRTSSLSILWFRSDRYACSSPFSAPPLPAERRWMTERVFFISCFIPLMPEWMRSISSICSCRLCTCFSRTIRPLFSLFQQTMSWNSFTPYRMERSDRNRIAGSTKSNIGYLSYKSLAAPSSTVTMIMRNSIQSISPAAAGVRINRSSILLMPCSFSRKSRTIFFSDRYRTSAMTRHSIIHWIASPAFTAMRNASSVAGIPFPASQFHSPSSPSPSSPNSMAVT